MQNCVSLKVIVKINALSLRTICCTIRTEIASPLMSECFILNKVSNVILNRAADVDSVYTYFSVHVLQDISWGEYDL